MTVYVEEVMDHYKYPRNKGRIEDPTVSLRDTNPFCGDDIHVHLKLEGDKLIGFSYEGQGCAISQAAASMLSERVIGMHRSEIMKLGQDDMISLLGIPVSGMRMKCAMLALRAIQKALGGNENVER